LKVLSAHNTRRANLVGLDHEATVKRNLPIVSAIYLVAISYDILVILIVHEASTMIQPIIHSCQNFSLEILV
jgi:hypothetical protein